MLKLPGVVHSSFVKTEDWENAKDKIRDTKECLCARPDKGTLIVTADGVNLCGLFLFGWYMDHRRWDILFTPLHGRKEMFPLEGRLGKADPHFLSPRMEAPTIGSDGKYDAVALRVVVNANAAAHDMIPVETFLNSEREKGRFTKAYNMSFTSTQMIAPTTDLAEACYYIAKSLREKRSDMDLFSHHNVPVYIFLNVFAAGAISLGMQLGNEHNLRVCAFANETKEYYLAFEI